jgi:hypothetical protein
VNSKLITLLVGFALTTAAGLTMAGCGEDSQRDASSDRVSAYFGELAGVDARFQAKARDLENPHDTVSKTWAALAHQAAVDLDAIESPAQLRDEHEEYANSVLEYSESVNDLVDAGYDTAALLQIDQSTAPQDLVGLLNEFNAANERVGDACTALQDYANERYVNIDIGCRGATTAFECYGPGASGVTFVESYQDALRYVESFYGKQLPIPREPPPWADSFQTSYDNDEEHGDARGLRFGSSIDSTRPQVAIEFAPGRPCNDDFTGDTVTIQREVIRVFSIEYGSNTHGVRGVEAAIRVFPELTANVSLTWLNGNPPTEIEMLTQLQYWLEQVASS